MVTKRCTGAPLRGGYPPPVAATLVWGGTPPNLDSSGAAAFKGGEPPPSHHQSLLLLRGGHLPLALREALLWRRPGREHLRFRTDELLLLRGGNPPHPSDLLLLRGGHPLQGCADSDQDTLKDRQCHRVAEETEPVRTVTAGRNGPNGIESARPRERRFVLCVRLSVLGRYAERCG